MKRDGRLVVCGTDFFVLIAVLVPCHLGADAGFADGLNSEGPAMAAMEILPVRDRALELSGCAVVDGGLLVVEDELIGSVILLPNVAHSPLVVKTIKLERKKKERAPFAEANKLFPIQDFEDIATNRKDLVYLIGSHQGRKGERRPDREFLLRANWDAEEAELKVRGEQYRLLDHIAPVLAGIGCDIGLNKTEVDPALNIEGLAWHDGRLFLGLRSPTTPSGAAILLSARVDDAFSTRKQGIWQPITLDLDGAGIRALDWDPVTNSLLVVSGPASDGDKADAALWHCAMDGAALRRLYVFPPDVAKKAPEGVCRLDGADGAKLLVALDGEGEGKGGAEVVLLEGL